MNDAEHSKALVRRLVEIVNAGDLTALPEVATGPIAEAAEGSDPFGAPSPTSTWKLWT